MTMTMATPGALARRDSSAIRAPRVPSTASIHGRPVSSLDLDNRCDRFYTLHACLCRNQRGSHQNVYRSGQENERMLDLRVMASSFFGVLLVRGKLT